MAFQLTEYDRELISRYSITVSDRFSKDKEIILQFPPKIISDGKSADWELKPSASYEPKAVFKGAQSRKISLMVTYVVTGGKFDAEFVATQVRSFKEHMYRSIVEGEEGEGAIQNAPIVKLNLYRIAPISGRVPTFRMTDVAIEYSETLVGDVEFVFPLKTIITANLELFTKVGDIKGNVTDDEVKNDVQNLPDLPAPEWY